MRDRVTDRVVLQMPHVGLARRVREHLEHVGARRPVIDVRNFPGALALPDRLPSAFDLVRLVTMLGHWARRLAPPGLVSRSSAAFPSGTRTSVRVVSSTTQKGSITEMVIATEALKAGVCVLRPMAEGGRYDLAFEIDGRF